MNIRMELTQIDKMLRKSTCTGALPVIVRYEGNRMGSEALASASRAARAGRLEDLVFFAQFYFFVLAMSMAFGALCAALLVDCL